MSPASQSLDALVVGAGWSGLMCALHLATAGKRVLCVEARQRLGGRAFTHTFNEDTPMENAERKAAKGGGGSSSSEGGQYSVDFGCSYIHGFNEGNPVKEIAKKFGVQTFVPSATPARIVGPDGTLSERLTQKLQANLQAAQESAKEKGKALREGGGKEEKGDEVSLSSAILDDAESPLYAQLTSAEERSLAASLARLMHVPLGVEMERVALQFFGHEANYAGTDAMPEGGFSTLIERIAEQVELAGGQVKLGEEVKAIKQVSGASSSSSVQIITRSDAAHGGQEHQYSAQTAIVTVPLAVLKANQGMFEPALESDRQDAIKRTTVGNLNKVLLSYDKPWWPSDVGTFFVLPEDGKSAQTGSPNKLESLFASTTLIASSLCAPNGLPSNMQAPALLVMIGGAQGKQLESFDRLDVAQALHNYLGRRMLEEPGQQTNAPLRHTFYSRWARQPFTGGATTTPITLGNSPLDFRTLARPAWNDSLYFAGEHCDVDHRGSIAGAVVSASTASEAVLRHLAASSRM